MAFSSIVDDSRRMNAKMIAMGQSVDIQKMPRPKPSAQAAAQRMTFTPEGSELEKMLYPKNFKPRTFDSETKSEDSQIIRAKENNSEMVKEIEEQTQATESQKEPAPIIGDDAIIIEAKRETAGEINQKSFSAPRWERCKHYKAQGERAFCREYLGWCAKEKCARPQF